ncbi:MAG: AMP-binding protein, partial [bacterium]|nr:AMP-binding protein [bacterium]
RIVRHFKRLLDSAIVNVDKPISRIDILSPREKEQLLLDFNDTTADYPAHKTIDQLFQQQAARTPGHTALTYEGDPMSYDRLNKESGALAYYLRCRGVKNEEPVALAAENSHKVIVAILGILKAGGAYLPLNVDYPDERKKYILNDANVRLLLTNCEEENDFFSNLINLEDSSIYQNQPGGTRIYHN